MTDRTGVELTAEERKALEAVVANAVGAGDLEGDLGHAERWVIVRAVVDELMSGRRRKTSTVDWFTVAVTLTPDPVP